MTQAPGNIDSFSPFSPLSRRAAVMGGLAVFALPGAALAVASREADPIFAAIEGHEAAWRAAAAAVMAEDDYGNDESDPRPDIGIEWRDYSFIVGEEIEWAHERYIAMASAGELGRVTIADIEAEYREAIARHEAAICAEAEWKQRSPLGHLVLAREAASEREDGAVRDLVDTVPTTMAGVVALLSYVDRFDRSEIKIADDWPTDYHQWPATLICDEERNWCGGPLKLPFHTWILRNALAALKDIHSV